MKTSKSRQLLALIILLIDLPLSVLSLLVGGVHIWALHLVYFLGLIFFIWGEVWRCKKLLKGKFLLRSRILFLLALRPALFYSFFLYCFLTDCANDMFGLGLVIYFSTYSLGVFLYSLLRWPVLILKYRKR